MGQVLFHLAFPVTDIAAAKTYYGEGLGCRIGRENAKSVILNLYGHQLVAHLVEQPLPIQTGIYPRHFGLVFTELADWDALIARSQHYGLQFYQSPKTRFVGSLLEHRTFFLQDPFHNLMEFKHYAHPSAIFGEVEFTQIGDRT
ncbi:MAG: VOC family protein [Elainella sp. Prado103]|nr:VOC family protein [Elainella sp. Prado103]